MAMAYRPGFEHRAGLVLNFVHIAGEELDLGIFKRLAAGVVHCNPADHIYEVAFLRRDEIVTGAPIEAGGDIADFGVHLAGLVGLEQPVEGGFENGVITQAGEQRLAGQGKLQFAVHVNDGLPRFAAGKIAAANDFAGNQLGDLRVVLGADNFEINRLALEQREQQFLGHGIISVILFQNLEGAFACRDRAGSQNPGSTCAVAPA